MPTNQLEQMMTWPSDPRIARWMFQCCISKAFSDRPRTWSVVADLLVKNVDVRLAPDLEDFAETRGENKARRSAMRRAGPAALKAIAAVPEATVARRARRVRRVERRARRVGCRSAPSRSAACSRRSPRRRTITAPALVYADWLTERGHPRGELIVLQCSERV